MTPINDLSLLDEAIRQVLQTDLTIDIVTTGARSGQPRRTEIWFWNLDGRIIICGTPSAGGERGPRPVAIGWPTCGPTRRSCSA